MNREKVLIFDTLSLVCGTDSIYKNLLLFWSWEGHMCPVYSLSSTAYIFKREGLTLGIMRA